MKKIISIVGILLCFATTYGQETKPTKQETMDWMAEKMKKYLQGERRFISYSNGVFKYKDEDTECTIYLERVSSFDGCALGGQNMVGHKNYDKYDKKYVTDYSNYKYIVCKKRNGGIVAIDVSVEEGLHYRFNKAAELLVLYNNEKKPGEKF